MHFFYSTNDIETENNGDESQKSQSVQPHFGNEYWRLQGNIHLSPILFNVVNNKIFAGCSLLNLSYHLSISEYLYGKAGRSSQQIRVHMKLGSSQADRDSNPITSCARQASNLISPSLNFLTCLMDMIILLLACCEKFKR